MASSVLQTFASWTSTYKTWDDLKCWLQKEETAIDILESEDNTRYVILRNSRDDTGSEVAQLCRSVIWDTKNNVPCSVAPFAARRDQKIPMDIPLQLEDFVEGVMINVFRARGDKETHVTTRSKLEAEGSFYSERSFRELFEEAMDAKKTSLDQIERMIGAPSETVAATFITMVLAHPEHRVVRTVEQANLWAIYRGTVANDGTVTFYTDGIPLSWRPKTYSLDFCPADFATLKAKFEEIKATKPWFWQGLAVNSGAGAQRWRFRNGDHDRVRKELRGTESNSFGRFLRLRSQRRVQEYLRIYSEDTGDFQTFEQDYRIATRTLYAWYCKVHKEHSVIFKALPKSVQPLVFDLHKFYLGTLRPDSRTLKMAETIEWIGEYLKSPFGVPNMIRFSKETEQPPAGLPQVVPLDERVTLSIDDSVEASAAVAPLSPVVLETDV